VPIGFLEAFDELEGIFVYLKIILGDSCILYYFPLLDIQDVIE
jgi:hypothetical protein